jgi:hypothetical protein
VPNAAIVKISRFTSINKEAYLKGKRANLELERRLIDHMFEIELDQDYEKIYMYRDFEGKKPGERASMKPRLASAVGARDSL